MIPWRSEGTSSAGLRKQIRAIRQSLLNIVLTCFAQTQLPEVMKRRGERERLGYSETNLGETRGWQSAGFLLQHTNLYLFWHTHWFQDRAGLVTLRFPVYMYITAETPVASERYR